MYIRKKKTINQKTSNYRKPLIIESNKEILIILVSIKVFLILTFLYLFVVCFHHSIVP